MITRTLAQAAATMAGDLQGADAAFRGVSTDTRTLVSGNLFFALRGETHDAAAFVGRAFASGATAAVVAHDAVLPQDATGPTVRVDDPRRALGRLAADWRARHPVPAIAVTGSSGKTTVKEMIAAVLREAAGAPERVLATEGNLNNDIGVPLTLLRLGDEHRYAVVEMGMNHEGEIRHLTHLTRPQVALVNNAGRAHIGLLGSIEAIARAKGEIYEGLADGGTAVINADDAFAPYWRGLNAGRRVVEFALDGSADLRARYHDRGIASDIVLTTPVGDVCFTLPAPGAHNVRNALAAAAATFSLALPIATIADGLARYRGIAGRLERRPGLNGADLIDDSYNANPDSVLAAIAVLAALAGRRVLVLGDMGELGPDAAQIHASVGAAAREAGIDRLVTLGDLSRNAAEAFGAGAKHHQHVEDLLADLAGDLRPGATILIKGSRFMRMERVVGACSTTPASAGAGAH